MIQKKSGYHFFMLMLLVALILWGGPLMSGFFANKKQERIDQNGLVIPALVSGKKVSKGQFVYFTYTYLGNVYDNRELNDNYYQQLSAGDSIQIKIDTTDPGSSYIFATEFSK
jgi:hypothetical protein